MGKARETARQVPKPARQVPDFTQLPERIAPEDMTTTQDIDPGPDPRGGRDTDTEFMLRNAGF
jgi:hypothetical protein